MEASMTKNFFRFAKKYLHVHLLHALTLFQTTNFRLKAFADANSKFDENGRISLKRAENTVEKGQLLDASNFSFSHSVFKRRVLKTCENQGLFEKELISRLKCGFLWIRNYVVTL